MFRSRFLLIFLVIVAVIFLTFGFANFTGLERDSLTKVEVILRDIFLPVQRGVNFVAGTSVSFLESIKSYQSLQRENQQLQEKVAELSALQNRMAEMEQENKRLTELLGFKNQMSDSYQFLSAQVVGRDASNWYSSFVLDVGKNDGIEKNMVVVNQEGLIGRIIAVSENSSEVLTILDPQCAVPALLQESRYPGVAEGVGSSSRQLQLIYLPYNIQVSVGETVVTSGLGQIFPKGLKIGEVKEVVTEPSGLTQRAILQPTVDFDRLEEVLVIVKTL